MTCRLAAGLGLLAMAACLSCGAPGEPAALDRQAAPQERRAYRAPPANPVDPQIGAVVPAAGTPKWKRFALLVGLLRLSERGGLEPGPRQARAILEQLEGLRRSDAVNDFLFTSLLQTLTGEQVRYMAAHVRRPPGTCTCPCTTWDPLLVRAKVVLERRAGGAAPALEIPSDLDRWEAEQEEDLEALYSAPDVLILLQGISAVEAVDGLRVTPEQARRLIPILDGMAATLVEIERRMLAMEAALTWEQRAFIEREGAGWLAPGATSAQLNERWEAWLAEAIARMQATSG